MTGVFFQCWGLQWATAVYYFCFTKKMQYSCTLSIGWLLLWCPLVYFAVNISLHLETSMPAPTPYSTPSVLESLFSLYARFGILIFSCRSMVRSQMLNHFLFGGEGIQSDPLSVVSQRKWLSWVRVLKPSCSDSTIPLVRIRDALIGLETTPSVCLFAGNERRGQTYVEVSAVSYLSKHVWYQ